MRTAKFNSISEVIDQMDRSNKTIITKKRYDLLKSFQGTLSEHEKQLIADYENNEFEMRKKVSKEETKVEPIERQKIIIDLQWMKREFIKHWKYNERNRVDNTAKEIILTERHKIIIESLCLYFLKDKSGPLDINKGILLQGPTGTGKSSFMKAFHTIGEMIYNRTRSTYFRFHWNNCEDLVDEFEGKETDNLIFFQRYGHSPRMFDDLGTEGIASKFGKTNIMQRIIKKRYLTRSITHFTTNNTEQELKDLYGFRVWSRLRDMCNIIILEGDDMRCI